MILNKTNRVLGNILLTPINIFKNIYGAWQADIYLAEKPVYKNYDIGTGSSNEKC